MLFHPPNAAWALTAPADDARGDRELATVRDVVRRGHFVVAGAVALAATVATGCSSDVDTPSATAPLPPISTEAGTAASVSTDDVATTLPATVASQAPTETTAAETSGGTYIVQAGDSLTVIAQRVGTTIDAIWKYNDWEGPNHLIYEGMKLKLPPKKHT